MVEGRWQLGTVLSCLPWPDLWSVRSRLASKTQLSSWIQWLSCCLLSWTAAAHLWAPLSLSPLEGRGGRGGDGGDCFLLHPPLTLRSRKSLGCTAC